MNNTQLLLFLLFNGVVFLSIIGWSSYSLQFGYNHKRTLAYTSIALAIQIYVMAAMVIGIHLLNK